MLQYKELGLKRMRNNGDGEERYDLFVSSPGVLKEIYDPENQIRT